MGGDGYQPKGDSLGGVVLDQESIGDEKGRVPTFAPDNEKRSTIIDITVVNDWAIRICTVLNWHVDLDVNSFSDHRIIRWELSTSIEKDFCATRRIRKANWDAFTAYLDKMKIDAQWAEKDVNEMCEMLEGDLIWALDQAAPLKLRNFTTRDSWWNDTLTMKRKILRNVYKKRSNHPRLLEKYRELKSDLARAIQQAKRGSWRDFCTRTEGAKEISRLVQILENPPKRQMSILHKDGQLLSAEGSLRHLIETHFPEGNIVPDTDKTAVKIMGHNMDVDYTGICEFINAGRVRAALSSFGDFKSPGPDKLPPVALKKMGDRHIDMLTDIYKKSIATGTVPARWTQMKVVFIPKSGKSDYAVAKAYRPITLSNFLLKGLERLIQWFILSYHITEPLYRQHAYTKGRSCDTALSVFINDIEKAVYNSKYVLAVSLDCSGAFDCIKFSSAEKNMRLKIRWYMDLLKNRVVTASVQGQCLRVIPARGSPQGGVLSPLIWNLIMDSLLTQFKRGPTKVLGYADDILIYTEGICPVTMGESLQSSLDFVLRWGTQNGLTFNPAKTNIVLFTKRKKQTMTPLVYMNGVALELRNSFQYLGVEIQKRLSWTGHIRSRINKCKFLMTKCKNIVRQKWGLTPEKVEWIHNAIVRPKITYGSVVWASHLTQNECGLLHKVQRLSLVAMTQPLRSAPTAGLEAMMGWLPLSLHAREIGLNTYMRIKDQIQVNWDSIGTQKNICGHLGLWKEKIGNLMHDNFPVQKYRGNMTWFNNKPMEKSTPVINMYTDASKIGQNA